MKKRRARKILKQCITDNPPWYKMGTLSTAINTLNRNLPKVIIAVSEDCNIQEVAERLKGRGLTVADILPVTGIITGWAGNVENLRRDRDVLSVEREGIAETQEAI